MSHRVEFVYVCSPIGCSSRPFLDAEPDQSDRLATRPPGEGVGYVIYSSHDKSELRIGAGFAAPGSAMSRSDTQAQKQLVAGQCAHQALVDLARGGPTPDHLMTEAKNGIDLSELLKKTV
jgi:hypothetical protein